MYNQDNREKVVKDEAAYEEVQKAKRAKHQKAESEYRHAIMLARVRGEPQVGTTPGSPITTFSIWTAVSVELSLSYQHIQDRMQKHTGSGAQSQRQNDTQPSDAERHQQC